MRSLMLHAPAAYIASVCSSGYGLQSLTHLTHAVEMFNVCVAPDDKISLDSLASSNINQKMLSSKLNNYQLQGIFNRTSVADSGGSTIALGGGGGGGAAAPSPPPIDMKYKMPPLLLNCRPPSHYDVHINTTRVTVFPHSGDVIHSQPCLGTGLRLK